MEKLVYFIPTALITFAFVTIYFPNRPISIINTMGDSFRREFALAWTLFIWIAVAAVSVMLFYPKTTQKILWGIYAIIILTVIGGCSCRHILP